MPDPIRVDPEEIQLRPEPFRLLRAAPRHAGAVLRRLAAMESAFQFINREADGLSLLISDDDARELGDLLKDAAAEQEPYRVITFTPTLPWTVVGFLARVTALLAEEGLPLGAISAFDRDHLFVREDRAEPALAILRRAASERRLP